MKYKRILSLLLVGVICFAAYSFSENSSEKKHVPAGGVSDNELAVHFFDVGQGDSEFIEFPDGSTMLIDAGERNVGKRVAGKIRSLGYNEITYVVATHPHSDHIGGLPEIFDSFDIGTVYLSDAVSSTAAYEKLLDRIEAEGCSVVEAKAGVSVISDEELKAFFVAPSGGKYDDLNNYSACLKLIYGNNSFLFMGDAEALSEKEITADVAADVLKVGHHGSSSSSSENFVKRVSPQYAVFEVGADNSYGHPHEEILELYDKLGVRILRTDLLGDIVFRCDGDKLMYEQQGE